MTSTAYALLSQALSLQASVDVQLLPAGEFAGRDGRPGKGKTWKLSDAQGQALAARLSVRHASVQFCFDYEHQAMLSETNGQPAPAAGWAQRFDWRPGVGLFALAVQWTDKARQMIEAGEYKYISPVIAYNSQTGEVTDVRNAALVNIPNLDLNPVAQERMAQLNAKLSTPETSPMNETLKALLKALNLADDTTPANATQAVAALKAQADATPLVVKALGLAEATTTEQLTAAVATLKTKADALPAVNKALGLAEAATPEQIATTVAALKAATQGEPDPTKYVSLDKFVALTGEVAALRATHVQGEVDMLIAAARAEGKCTPVVETVWRDIGKANIAQLKALIAQTPANPALAGQQQTNGKPPAVDPNAPGTPQELAMCKQMGLTLAQFRAGAETAAA